MSKRRFASGEQYGFYEFLSKFKILETIHWDERAIGIAINQVCWDMAREGLDYVELKFTVDKYMRFMDWTPQKAIKLIHHFVEQESQFDRVKVGLVLSIKYETDKALQKKIAAIIDDSDVADLVVGIDLVGDEAKFDPDFFVPLLKPWSKAGKGVMAHVGESQSAENVRIAIEKLNVKRVSHGIKAVSDPNIIALAKERNICFDIALSSNICTGVAMGVKYHPIWKLLEEGCTVTIGTDDPYVLNTTLDREYEMLSGMISDDKIMDIMDNSVKYALLDLKNIQK
jgi:adenosine deaminase